ncbi:MAG TPA: c-type cytochrome [Steroidobacteraceae bacterium]|nr:c-type cytochrome [Steroidobacteraceae bacterium]
MRPLLICALGALCGAWAAADEVPDRPSLAHGEHIARLICSACHVVAADQEYPPLLITPTPAFREIANRPGTTVETLRRFITTTHWDEGKLPMAMPDPMLTEAQARDVARYILSLRTH